jgi:hypothetical protein
MEHCSFEKTSYLHPILHYSGTPVLLYFSSPVLHYSILHKSGDPGDILAQDQGVHAGGALQGADCFQIT